MTRTWIDPRVTLAMSYAVGDNDQGDRIVGTTQEMFTMFTYREGQGFVLKSGRVGRRRARRGTRARQLRRWSVRLHGHRNRS